MSMCYIIENLEYNFRILNGTISDIQENNIKHWWGMKPKIRQDKNCYVKGRQIVYYYIMTWNESINVLNKYARFSGNNYNLAINLIRVYW